MAKLAILVVNVACGDLDAAFVTADEATADQADPVYRHLAYVWSAGVDAMLGDPQRAKRTIRRIGRSASRSASGSTRPTTRRSPAWWRCQMAT